MAIRGDARRTRTSIGPASFVWGREVAAVLRHSTLPWNEFLDPVPLSPLPELGGRAKLSLLAQFAAHQALLQFAGVADGACDLAEWSVVQRRGNDVRLVRTGARETSDPPPPLTIVQQFAEAIDAPAVEALRQSWGRPEAVYCEIEKRLRADAAADLRWMRRAAIGEIASPATDGLRMLASVTNARLRYSDPACIESIRLAFDRVAVLGETPSPLAPLREIVMGWRNESDLVERIVAADRLIVIVKNLERFDTDARRVIDLFAATGSGILLMPGGSDLPDSRFFVVSQRLESRRAVEAMLASHPLEERRRRLDAFAASRAFEAFLDDGAVPADDTFFDSLREPVRSLLGALALLGTRVPRPLGTRFLGQFLFGGSMDDLAAPGVAHVDDDALLFTSEAVRQQAMELVPAASRASLCRIAADIVEEAGDEARAASLYLDAGDAQRAVALLDGVSFPSDEQAIRTLRALPRNALSSRLAATLADALIRAGRYRDAREVASMVSGDKRESLLATIERRTGDYAPALARLERMTSRGFDAELLRAELLYLDRRYGDATKALGACRPSNADERDRLGYIRGILAVDRGRKYDATIDDPYLAARLAFYQSNTVEDALGALAAARSVAERVDAALDHIFALFTTGRWSEARVAALEALAMIDETQGDRAAGGILFLLAYLAADDGQWSHAEHLIQRLEQFYATTHDDQRRRELDLLRAQLDFCRGRFAAAARAAENIVALDVAPQIAEAAKLILDEIDSIEGRKTPLRSTGLTANAELSDRNAVLRARRGEPWNAWGDFTSVLIAWERGYDAAPRASNGSERLKLFRSALAIGWRNVAETIQKEMGITLDSGNDESPDVRVLRIAATAAFPFTGHDFGALQWRFATRNRLGHWSEIGSLPPLDRAALDRALVDATGDWIHCGDRELLWIDGACSWPSASRDAAAAIFRVRSENYRLQRAMAQEENAAGVKREPAVDGIVGESPAIREVFAVIDRVAPRDVAVCILGESGTGKELVARAIHRRSPRRRKPFTAVNCAALPETLIESELFGSARGAFTGADRDRAGLIETTDGGTLFLDEIGELPLAAQAKLLRFLQEGEIRRVGETVSRGADVRIVTATNRKLDAAVEQGRFREDLYYRICGIEIALPPLRERSGDIPLLVAHFLALEHEKHRGGPTSLAADAEALILAYPWPGNVRELQNTIRAAHALAGEAKAIGLDHLPQRLRGGSGKRLAASSYHDAVTRFRRELIERSLAEADGNQNQAAIMLNMSRQALAYQIRELGILVKRRV